MNKQIIISRKNICAIFFQRWLGYFDVILTFYKEIDFYEIGFSLLTTKIFIV